MGLEVSMKSLALRVVLTIGLKLQIQTAQNKNEKITKKFAVLFICLKKKLQNWKLVGIDLSRPET